MNHLEGHIHAVFLEAHKAGISPVLPAVCLIVSGGHTVLYEVQPKDSARTDAGALWSYRRIGQTRDDAAGEAYDKVSKLLGLGYPGGPILDRLAAAAGNAPAPVKFGPTKMKGNSHDFSFSGLEDRGALSLAREPATTCRKFRPAKQAIARGERKFDQLLAAMQSQNAWSRSANFRMPLCANWSNERSTLPKSLTCSDRAGFWWSRCQPATSRDI